MTRNRLVSTIAVLLVLASGPASGEVDPAGSGERGVFNFQFENDVFGALGEDRHYTQGTRLSWLTRGGGVPGWVHRGARSVPFYPDGGRLRASWALEQSLYTPEDIKSHELIEDDRPYAAWLRAGVGLIADTGRSLDTVELSVGMVGPSALGEELQSWFHGIIDSPNPNGWEHQLHDELTLQLFYEHKWRERWTPGWLRALGLATEITPHLGGALGNVFIQGATGATLRVGNDLPADYGVPRIRPSLPGSEFFVPGRTFSAYVFGGVEIRAVARNLFLDGNTFGSSHSVDKEPLVGDFQGGVALVVARVRLAFTYVYRTPEFRGQTGADRFGAITVSAIP